MADGAAGSCLSDLSDDLLRHILSFAPAKEGAATALLSRRWRCLWRTSGAVNIDSRSLKRRRSSSSHEPSEINKRSRSQSRSCASSSSSDDDDDRGCRYDDSKGEGFFRSAEKALVAADGPIRRLTFFVAKNSKINLARHLVGKDGSWSPHDLMESLIRNTAARRVEDLRIEVENSSCMLSFGSLPSEALRVLRIRNSTLVGSPVPGAVLFPRLADLHLQGCGVDLKDFESTIAAAPQLSTLHLQSSNFFVGLSSQEVLRCYRFLCPTVTTLVIADCTFTTMRGERDNLSVELDVPRLQYFRYEGSLQVASQLRRPKPHDMILPRVDLHLSRDCYDENKNSHAPIRKLFWQFVRDFNTTRLLKLKLVDLFMDEVVLEEDEGMDELLRSLSFCRLEQLELEACSEYDPRVGISTVLLADLLHCCPVVRNLRLKFSKVEGPLDQIDMEAGVDCDKSVNMEAGVDHDKSVNMEAGVDYDKSVNMEAGVDYDKSVNIEAGVDYDKSINGFRNRRRSSMASLGEENGDNYQSYGIIPGLTSDRPFSCLQSHLERVSLCFCMDDPNCLGVQLAKFFAMNAMVLQEMHIDDGSHEMLEHVNHSLRRWIDKENLIKVGGEMRRIKLQH